MTSERLFHLADREAWTHHWAQGSGPWRPASLAREGFCHLSLAAQLEGTLAAHFSGAGPLVLIEVDSERAGRALRFEVSRGDALFPHLYRPIEREDVLGTWPLQSGPAGWNLPALGARPKDDDPPAEAPSGTHGPTGR